MTTQEALEILEISAPVSRESLNDVYQQLLTVWNPASFGAMEDLQIRAAAKLDKIYAAYLWLYELPDDAYPYRLSAAAEPRKQGLPRRTLPPLPVAEPKTRTAGGLHGKVDLAAPFMRRVGAFVIDAGLGLFAWMGVLFLKEYQAIQKMAATGQNQPVGQTTEEQAWLAVSVCVLMYFALLECSGLQASLGKRMLGLVVTDYNGSRASVWRGTLRVVGMLASVFFPPLYFACLWTPRRQCLHDLLAGCQVMWRLPAESAQAAMEKEAASQLSLKQLGGLAAALVVAGLARVAKDEMKNPSRHPAPSVVPVPTPVKKPFIPGITPTPGSTPLFPETTRAP